MWGTIKHDVPQKHYQTTEELKEGVCNASNKIRQCYAEYLNKTSRGIVILRFRHDNINTDITDM
jgi:hypothetical protein